MPVAITRRDDGIRVEWDGAGHTAVFPARELRLACACAECVEEMSGRRLLQPEQVPADIRPLRIDLVGTYGIRITWSDGHSTGIYTFERLLHDCPCARCSIRDD
ncbi:MAG TPA: DUF971 domain-containing protein [Gemmatimonadales bacterium]|nr:DUF971 domain-containing protein [Gemmatimonadales bacterium]